MCELRRLKPQMHKLLQYENLRWAARLQHKLAVDLQVVGERTGVFTPFQLDKQQRDSHLRVLMLVREETS